MALKINVTLADNPNEKIEVPILNPDRVRWDMAAARNGWPSMENAPFLGMTYFAWAALKREGLYTGTWDDFKDRDCIDLDSRDDAEDPDADPLGK